MSRSSLPGSRARAITVVMVAVFAIFVGAVIGWAGHQVFDPPRPKIADANYTFIRVAQGSVGSALSLNTTSQWGSAPVATNEASGVVTSVGITQGANVKSGDVLYSVGLRPVVAISGSVPSFRAFNVGTTGEDVTQLQTFLQSAGFLHGPVNGVFSATTKNAVLAWQKRLNVPGADGTTLAGDIVFIPHLPARLTLSSDIAVGQSLSGGEQVVQGLSTAPSFSIVATDDQAALVPEGSSVEVSKPRGGIWQGKIAGRKADGSGTQDLSVTASSGGTICGSECGLVPVGRSTLLDTKIVIVPQAKGLVVPAGAIETTASGTTIVLDSSNRRRTVKILASAQGMSVITGVPAGTRVRIPVSGD